MVVILGNQPAPLAESAKFTIHLETELARAAVGDHSLQLQEKACPIDTRA